MVKTCLMTCNIQSEYSISGYSFYATVKFVYYFGCWSNNLIGVILQELSLLIPSPKLTIMRNCKTYWVSYSRGTHENILSYIISSSGKYISRQAICHKRQFDKIKLNIEMSFQCNSKHKSNLKSTSIFHGLKLIKPIA